MAKIPAPDHSPALDNALADHQPGDGQAPYATQEGNGGETHQDAGAKGDPAAFLTDNFGHRLSDNQNSLKAGERGPTLLEDFILREKTSTSTMSASPSASSTPVALPRMACSR